MKNKKKISINNYKLDLKNISLEKEGRGLKKYILSP